MKRHGNAPLPRGMGPRDLTERRYHAVATAASSYIWYTDPAGGVTEIDEGWLQFTGLTLEETRGSGWMRVVHPDDRGPYQRAWRRALATGEVFEFEYRVLGRDGRTHWFHDRVVPVADDGGKVIEWIGAAESITERKEAELQLRYVSGLQELLVDISREFLADSSDGFHRRVDDALARVGSHCRVDRSYVFRFSADGTRYSNTHEWCAAGVEPQRDALQDISSDPLPKLMASVHGQRSVRIADVDALGPEQDAERQFFQGLGIRAVMVVPIIVDGETYGLMGFESTREARHWSDDEARLLQGLADLIGAAIRRDRMESDLRESEARLRVIADHVPGDVYQRVMDADGDMRVTHVSAGLGNLFGIEPQRALRDRGYLMDHIHPEDIDRYRAAVAESARTLERHDIEFRIRAPDGRQRWARSIASPRRGDDGAIIWDGIAIDETERKQAEAQLEQTRALMEIAGRTARVGGWSVDLASRSITWSDEVCAIHECPAGTTVPIDEGIGYYAPEHRERIEYLFHECATHGTPYDEELAIITARGNRVWVRVIAEAVRDGGGNVVEVRGALQDISQQREAQEEIEFLALYDPLTRLPNRRLLRDRLQQLLANRARTGRHAAVLFLDLDHFKTLNDTLGHDVGDLLLQQVAQRLTRCLREVDTVARFGGDEFVVVVADLARSAQVATEQAEKVAHNILTALTEPYHLDGHERHTTVSIGLTLFGDGDDTADELMKRVDLAMYHAKDAGRGTVRVFHPDMRLAVDARVRLEAELRTALRAGAIVPEYQPQVDADGRLIGAEALARWEHPEHGPISPAEFIPVAEQSGLIHELGETMLQTACEALVSWSARNLQTDFCVSVNVSARQFHHPGFVDQVKRVLARTGAPAEMLVLELTESMLLTDIEDTIGKMDALRAQGIGFSLDDFGTGYSSLAYLKRLPLSQLKIDQAFVRDALVDPNDAAIVRTIILLADTLGLGVIAEGVETEELRALLEGYGCRRHQGYAISHPLSRADFEHFMAAQDRG